MFRFTHIALLCFPLMLAGCGGGAEGENEVPVYPVSGTVTMFGSPLANATVAFAPESTESKLPTAVGTTDQQGHFELTTYEFGDGAAEGKYKVVIAKSSAASTSATTTNSEGHEVSTVTHGGGAKAASTAGLVPAQYTNSNDTPFTAEVKSSGDNNFPFEIK